MVACEELYDVFWTDVGAYSKPRHVLCGVLAFVREPELCLSVAEAIFLCALLLFLSFTVYCAVLFVFWRTVPLWNNLKINGPKGEQHWGRRKRQRYKHALR